MDVAMSQGIQDQCIRIQNTFHLNHTSSNHVQCSIIYGAKDSNETTTVILGIAQSLKSVPLELEWKEDVEKIEQYFPKKSMIHALGYLFTFSTTSDPSLDVEGTFWIAVMVLTLV